MHAGEVGVLIDDRADLRDISAMVIGLAVKGYLIIEEPTDEQPEQDGKGKGKIKMDKGASLPGHSEPFDYLFSKKKEGGGDRRLQTDRPCLLQDHAAEDEERRSNAARPPRTLRIHRPRRGGKDGVP